MKSIFSKVGVVAVSIAVVWTSGQGADAALLMNQPFLMRAIPRVMRPVGDPAFFTEQAIVERLTSQRLFRPSHLRLGGLAGVYRRMTAGLGISAGMAGLYGLWNFFTHLATQTMEVAQVPARAVYSAIQNISFLVPETIKVKAGDTMGQLFGMNHFKAVADLAGNGVVAPKYTIYIDQILRTGKATVETIRVPNVPQLPNAVLNAPVYSHPMLHQIFTGLHDPTLWLYVAATAALVIATGVLAFLLAYITKRWISGSFASAKTKRVTALGGLAMTIGGVVPALAQQPADPVNTASEHSINELIEEGIGQVNRDARVKGDVAKTAGDLNDAQTRANTLRGGFWCDLEQGPLLKRCGPYLIWNKSGHDPQAKHEDRQKALAAKQSEQQTESDREGLADKMLDGYNRYRIAHKKMEGLNTHLVLAQELAPKPGDAEDTLVKAESGYTLQLQSELATTEREAQQALEDIRKVLSEEQLPQAINFEIPDSKIDYEKLGTLLFTSPDPQALADALGIAQAVDQAQTEFEFNLRTAIQKAIPTGVAFNVVSFIAQPVWTALLGFVVPSFQTSDPFDAEGTLALLTEAQNSFLANRYQRFQDLNTLLQSIPKHRASARAFEAQAAAALDMAKDTSRSPEDRRRYNKESQDAQLQAENEWGKAAQLEQSARRVRVAGSFLDTLDAQTPEQIETYAKNHVQTIYAAAADYSASQVETFQKALGSYKPNSKRGKHVAAFTDPKAKVSVDKLRTLGEQPIQASDEGADAGNASSAAERAALSHPVITYVLTLAAGKIYLARTSNQPYAPSFQDYNSAFTLNADLTIPLHTGPTRKAQEAVNAANKDIVVKAKEAGDSDAAIQKEIAVDDIALLGQMLDAQSNALENTRSLIAQETDPQKKVEYVYLEKQIIARIASFETLKAEADGNAAAALNSPAQELIGASAHPVTVPQAVAAYRAALAMQNLADHAALSVGVWGWPMGNNSPITFNAVTGDPGPLLRRLWKKIFGGPLSADQIKARQAVEAARISTENWISRVRAARDAGEAGNELYTNKAGNGWVDLLQKILDGAVAHEQELINQKASPKEQLEAGNLRRQAETELLNAQREQKTFAKLAARAQKEWENLRDVLAKKDVKGLERKAIEEFSDQFAAFFLGGDRDPLLEQETLADLQVKTAKLLKTPGTAGITAWMAPYWLYFDDRSAGPAQVTSTLGFQAATSFDPLLRLNTKGAWQTIMDQAAQSISDATDKTDRLKILRTNRLATLSDIVASNLMIANEAMGLSDADDPSVRELQDRYLASQILLLQSGGQAGKSGTLGTERPHSITTTLPEQITQIATVIAYRVVPMEPPPAESSGKKLELPAATATAAAHNRTSFAGFSAFGTWPLWHRGALKTARQKADAAQATSNANDQLKQRTAIINTITSRLRIVGKLADEWAAAEKEALQARATLDAYKDLFAKGGCSWDNLTVVFERVQEADARLILARGELEKVEQWLELNLAPLTQAEASKLTEKEKAALAMIQRTPIAPPPAATVQWTETELAVRLHPGGNDNNRLATLLNPPAPPQTGPIPVWDESTPAPSVRPRGIGQPDQNRSSKKTLEQRARVVLIQRAVPGSGITPEEAISFIQESFSLSRPDALEQIASGKYNSLLDQIGREVKEWSSKIGWLTDGYFKDWAAWRHWALDVASRDPRGSIKIHAEAVASLLGKPKSNAAVRQMLQTLFSASSISTTPDSMFNLVNEELARHFGDDKRRDEDAAGFIQVVTVLAERTLQGEGVWGDGLDDYHKELMAMRDALGTYASLLRNGLNASRDPGNKFSWADAAKEVDLVKDTPLAGHSSARMKNEVDALVKAIHHYHEIGSIDGFSSWWNHWHPFSRFHWKLWTSLSRFRNGFDSAA